MNNFNKLFENVLNEVEKISSRLIKQYKDRAKAERKAGGFCKVDERLPSVDVKMSDGSTYYFQEWEAEDLLDEVPPNIDAEDYILAQAQNW